jgi:hypothetical protein
MAQQVIDTTTQNPGWVGDNAKTAFTKTNENFSDLYLGAGLSPGHIQGLGLIYVSPNTIRIDTGAAMIPSAGQVQRVSAPIDKAVSIGANAWGHVYLLTTAGQAAVEISTVAPVVYSGTARTKNGAATHRYLGSFKTDASGAMHRFAMAGDMVAYANPNANAGGMFRVLSNKTTAAEQSVSLSGILPAAATAVVVRQVFTRSAQDNASNIGFVAGNYWNNIGGLGVGFIEMPIITLNIFVRLNQDITDGNGGLFIDVQGYRLGR